jgi:hypothetical protein
MKHPTAPTLKGSHRRPTFDPFAVGEQCRIHPAGVKYNSRGCNPRNETPNRTDPARVVSAQATFDHVTVGSGPGSPRRVHTIAQGSTRRSDTSGNQRRRNFPVFAGYYLFLPQHRAAPKKVLPFPAPLWYFNAVQLQYRAPSLEVERQPPTQ